MWRAIDRARALCAPGGIFALALYVKTPLCGMWTVEKRLYAGHPWLRPLLLYSYTIPLLLRQTLATGNVLGYIREYKRKRGMSFMVDVKDWLGGYPYESVREEELIRDMEEAGFEMVNSRNTKAGLGLFGTGCGEWVFRRRGERA